ncbi:hypothetical protein ACFVR2_24845 [Gottfriedia sp. NPDC057991]|uniref:hypothetical protein n=1 Tax=Gottfriedia sp. NPDC057991 TaxID=3346298 RepID=UPI0036D8892A
MEEKKKYKIELSLIVYFCSFLVVFPISIPLYFVLGMMSGSASASTTDLLFYGFIIGISILGAILLNIIFKSGKPNNKTKWGIFIAHLFLIPLSVIFYNYLFFY